MARYRIALGILISVLLAAAAPARGDALHYSVDGSFFRSDQLYLNGSTPLIAFNGVKDAELPSLNSTNSQVFSLGSVQITPPPIGQSVTYTDQAFHIEVRVPSLDVVTGPDSDGWWHSERNSFMLTGRINGQISGGGTSSLNLTVDKIELGSWGPYIPEETRKFTFPIELTRLGFDPMSITLAPSSTSGVYSFLMNVKPVPEPTAIVPVALAAIWLVRSRRRVAKTSLNG